MRLFVAVPIPSHPELERAYQEIRSGFKTIRPVDPKKQHITLKFIGDPGTSVAEVVDALKGVGCGSGKFDCQVQGFGAFPDWRRPSVLWLSLSNNEAFTSLASAIDARTSERLKISPEKRPFIAHITLGRVKEARGIDLQNLKDLLGTTVEGLKSSAYVVQVDGLLLMNSDLAPSGPEYTVIERFPLSEH